MMSVAGTMHMPPMGEVERRMTLVRLADGRLVIWSAIALDEDQTAKVDAFGDPTYLVIPGDLHRMDARAWKQRYPQLIVVTPAAARAKVQEVVRVDATEIDLGIPGCATLSCQVPASVKRRWSSRESAGRRSC